MIRILLLSFSIFGIFSSEMPCRKLSFFGNTIQNKASLSPVIIVGLRVLKMPFGDSYNASIEIKSIIKGSLGTWKKNMLIASVFSIKNHSTDLCQFTSDGENSRIYFLQVLSPEHGEYSVLFNQEQASRENLEDINKTICTGCVETPKLFITEQRTTDNSLQLDCNTESKPSPIVKWVNSDGQNGKQIALRNGARLVTKAINDSNSAMYICTGTNVLGESTTNVIIRAKETGEVIRCAINDKLLCNGNGRCYKDSTEAGKMFCRCNDDFYGQRCSMKAFKGGRSPDNNQLNITPLDKSEIERMIHKATKTVALKYIIIGGAIVLAGCIIVIIAIIIMWKSYSLQTKKKYGRSRVEEDPLFGTNGRQNGDGFKMFQKYQENQVLLAPSKEQKNVSPKLPMSPGLKQSNNDHQFSENGIYEGVNVT